MLGRRARVDDAHAHRAHAPCGHRQVVPGSRLGPDQRGVHRLRTAVDYRIVDAILDVLSTVRLAEEALRIRLVLRKEKRAIAVTQHDVFTQLRMRGGNCALATVAGSRLEERTLRGTV